MLILNRILFVIIFLLGICPIVDAAEPIPEIGAAKADITPIVGLGEPDVWLAGFNPNSRATDVHSKLWARGLTIKYENKRIAIVAVDLIGLFRDETLKIREEYAKANPNKPIDYLIIASTHTHSGPDTIGYWGPILKTGVNPEYQAKIRKGVLEVLKNAVAVEKPARLRIARTEVPELIGDSRLPKVIDQNFWILTAEDAGGKIIATLTNWGIHSEVLNRDRRVISSDFPGTLRDKIEKTRGGVAIHVSGSVGGLTAPRFPKLDDLGQPFAEKRNDRVEQYGQMVARRALKAVEKPEETEFFYGPVNFRKMEIEIPLNNPSFMLGFKIGAIKRETIRENPPVLLSEVGLLTIGPVAMAIIPGELYPELAIGGAQDPADPDADFPNAPIEPLIFQQLPEFKYKMVFGLSNDMLGYIIPKRQWDREPPHCYKSLTRPYGEVNSCGPEAAPIICEAFRKLAADLRKDLKKPK